MHRRFGVYAGSGVDTGGVADIPGGKKRRFSDLRGTTGTFLYTGNKNSG